MNIPLVEALLEMPGYTKFIKDVVIKKRTIDFEIVEISHSCRAIMSSNMMVKKKDPGAFIIPYIIGVYQFDKALCDLGVSINLIPLAIFNKLGLGATKSTTMRLLMSDWSII